MYLSQGVNLRSIYLQKNQSLNIYAGRYSKITPCKNNTPRIDVYEVRDSDPIEVTYTSIKTFPTHVKLHRP